MTRFVARTLALLVGIAGLTLLPAATSRAAAPTPWWLMPSTTQGEAGWIAIQSSDAGFTGVSDRSWNDTNDSEYWYQIGGRFRKTRIAAPQGGNVEFGRQYGVSKDGRVVYLSADLKNGTNAVYRSTNHGASFVKIFQGSQYCGISALTANASGSTVAFFSCGAMRYSTNLGTSFATVPNSENVTELRAVGANEILMARYDASQTTRLWRYNGSSLSQIAAFGSVPGSAASNGISASDNGAVIAVRMDGASPRTLVSRNSGGSWGTVSGVSSYNASAAVVSRNGSDIYLANDYDVYRFAGTVATVYGNIRDRVLSLPSHPEVGLLATNSGGNKLYATAYKSGTSDIRNDYLLETKHHTPKLKKRLKIVGKAKAGKKLKARKPVARAGHYTCTVTWKAGKKQVSHKTKIRVKKAWRKKKLTVRATCRSVTHVDFTRKKSVRIR